MEEITNHAPDHGECRLHAIVALDVVVACLALEKIYGEHEGLGEDGSGRRSCGCSGRGRRHSEGAAREQARGGDCRQGGRSVHDGAFLAGICVRNPPGKRTEAGQQVEVLE